MSDVTDENDSDDSDFRKDPVTNYRLKAPIHYDPKNVTGIRSSSRLMLLSFARMPEGCLFLRFPVFSQNICPGSMNHL